MTEKRKFLRFEAVFNALCDIIGSGYKEACRIKNISKEGALVIINRKLNEGDEINLSMDVPGDNVPIFASGEVAWQKDSTHSDKYDTGVKFTKINSLDKGRLLEYIYTQWLRLLNKTP